MNVRRPYRIVVALDLSEYSEIVLEHALDQAARHDATDLHFLTVCREGECEAAGQRLATQVLDGVETTQQSWRVALHVRSGDIAEEITRLAAELGADLIVIGRFGVHRRREMLTTRTIEDAPCPVLVVGLTEHVVETVPQCDACAAVREATNAESLFCAEHAGDSRVRSTSLLAWSPTLTHSQVW
jgi:nucleotide-binding universal stress UspA family protein